MVHCRRTAHKHPLELSADNGVEVRIADAQEICFEFRTPFVEDKAAELRHLKPDLLEVCHARAVNFQFLKNGKHGILVSDDIKSRRRSEQIFVPAFVAVATRRIMKAKADEFWERIERFGGGGDTDAICVEDDEPLAQYG